MPPLIEELCDLSDNTPLYDRLRQSGGLASLPEELAGAAFPPKGRKAELLASVREAVVPALAANDASALQKLIDSGDTAARITVLGELVLTLSSLAEGGHAGATEEAVREAALGLALGLARDLEADPPQDRNDPELLAHGIAMREWAHLFAGYYRDRGVPAYEAELLMIRARATNQTLSIWAHLVGAAMVDVARALEGLGRVEMAMQCYHGVRLDLRYLLKRPNVFPEHETGCALYWLQRACEERIRLVPDDDLAKADLFEVREQRRAKGPPDATSAPRFGPIARTYLGRTPYLARLLRDLQATYDEDREKESVAAVCDRYGCLSTDVEFYVSAIGSYHLRRGVLAGVHATYDEAHQEVFAALDYLKGQREGA
jgi:hypothetical protein